MRGTGAGRSRVGQYLYTIIHVSMRNCYWNPSFGMALVAHGASYSGLADSRPGDPIPTVLARPKASDPYFRGRPLPYLVLHGLFFCPSTRASYSKHASARQDQSSGENSAQISGCARAVIFPGEAGLTHPEWRALAKRPMVSHRRADRTIGQSTLTH